MKPILIIKTGCTFPAIAARYGDFEDWIISGMGLPEDHFRVVAPFLAQPLPLVDEISGVVITGSHAMVTDKAEWSVKTAEWLKSLAATDIPVLGICYGHQLLAEAFGGKVDFHPGGREIGTVEISCSAAAQRDPLFGCLPETCPAYVAHAQSVVRLPPRAVLLAQNDFEPHHAFVIDNHIWGVQFHPEFDEKITAAYIDELGRLLKDEGFSVSQLVAALKPSCAAALLEKFGQLCRKNQIN